MFSPRTRGYSLGYYGTGNICYVFPAHAGIFRCRISSRAVKVCFPRARGDIPRTAHLRRSQRLFSPRTRGYSRKSAASESPCTVFPAHAGIFRRGKPVACPAKSFPRARGDIPFLAKVEDCHANVFPAHAGIFPRRRILISLIGCFPRARGDIPRLKLVNRNMPAFSPRTRGYSALSPDSRHQ